MINAETTTNNNQTQNGRQHNTARNLQSSDGEMNLTNAHILVVGLGVTGVALARFLKKKGAVVTATDLSGQAALGSRLATVREMGVRLEEAEEFIRRALELKPGDGYFTDSLGWVYFKMGRHEEALQWIQKALERLPDDPLITEHLGDTYAALGRWHEARQAYERALRLGHENPDQLETKLEKSRKKVNKEGDR